MEGHLDPQDRAVRRLRLMGLAVALVLAVLVVVLVSDLPHHVRQTVTLTTLALSGVVAALGFRRRILASTGRRQRAYLLFAGACLLARRSNLLQLVLPRATVRGRVMPGDVVLTLALAVGVAGMVHFPSRARRTTDLTRMVLDGIVIGGSILLVADVTLFPDLLVDNPGGWPLLVVPVTDVVLATLATLLYLRSRRDHLMLGLLAVSFFCFAASDFGFAFVAASGRQFTYGSLVDAGWLSGYLLLVLAIWVPAHGPVEPDVVAAEKSPVLSTAVMFVLFLVGLGITLVKFSREGVSLPAVVLLLLVVLAVLARQSLLGGRQRPAAPPARGARRGTHPVAAPDHGPDRPDGRLGRRGHLRRGPGRPHHLRQPGGRAGARLRREDLIGRDAHVTFHARGPDGKLLPQEQCYITEAVARGPGRRVGGRQLRPPRRPPPPRRGHHHPADRGRHGRRGGRDLPRRHPAPRGGTTEVRVRLHGQPRAPHPAHRDPGVAGTHLRRRARPAARRAARMLEIASISAHRLNRLVDDILDIERIESGVLVLQPAWQDARVLVGAAVEQMQVLAVEAGVKLRVGTVSGAVHADPDRATQTLINLIGNALKFSYPGGARRDHRLGGRRRRRVLRHRPGPRDPGRPARADLQPLRAGGLQRAREGRLRPGSGHQPQPRGTFRRTDLGHEQPRPRGDPALHPAACGRPPRRDPSTVEAVPAAAGA